VPDVGDVIDAVQIRAAVSRPQGGALHIDKKSICAAACHMQDSFSLVRTFAILPKEAEWLAARILAHLAANDVQGLRIHERMVGPNMLLPLARHLGCVEFRLRGSAD